MNYMYINEHGDWTCQYCCTSALMYESVSHLPDCPVVCDSDMCISHKTIHGLNEAQWKERYIAYMKAHSDAEDWECNECASMAWDEAIDETPEECAETELSYW